MFAKNEEVPEFEYFSVFDTKVGVYKDPMLALNRHDMLRQIHDLFRDPDACKNQLVTNAEDFQLFKVGEYSRRTGVIKSTRHEHIANLHEIKVAAQRVNQPLPQREVKPMGIVST